MLTFIPDLLLGFWHCVIELFAKWTTISGRIDHKKLLSYSETFSDGNFNHGDTNHIFGGLGEDFKIFGQASKST